MFNSITINCLWWVLNPGPLTYKSSSLTNKGLTHLKLLGMSYTCICLYHNNFSFLMKALEHMNSNLMFLTCNLILIYLFMCWVGENLKPFRTTVILVCFFKANQGVVYNLTLNLESVYMGRMFCNMKLSFSHI